MYSNGLVSLICGGTYVFAATSTVALQGMFFCSCMFVCVCAHTCMYVNVNFVLGCNAGIYGIKYYGIILSHGKVLIKICIFI